MKVRLCILLTCVAAVALAQQKPCPAAEFLDVSKYEGAGAAYAKPRLEATCEGDELVVRSNGIPHYEFIQVTPNPLLEQDYEFRVPLTPKKADKPIPIPLLGSEGFTVGGLAIYGPNEGPIPQEAEFGDPVFHSIMDACMGHTALEYHYHALIQRCLSEVKDGDRSPVLGYAYDGYAIRGPWGCLDGECNDVVKFKSSWEKVGNPDIDSWDAFDYVAKDGPEYLDQCNGHTDYSGDYHYHATETWPYIIGCYSGEPLGMRNRGRRPPQVSENAPPRRPRPGPGGARPGPEQVSKAAAALGVDAAKVAKALRVEPGGIKPVNMAAAARTLGVAEPKLREAMGGGGRGGRPPRVNQNPPGEPECFFRCGQSDEDAVGCTLSEQHKVVCHRPCDDNKCG